MPTERWCLRWAKYPVFGCFARAAQSAHSQSVCQIGRPQAPQAKQAINQHIARAEALGDDLDKVAGTSLLAKVSVRALRKLQVRAARVAGFSPSWGRTAAVPCLSRCCPMGQGRRLAKTKWFPDGFDLETVWVFRWPPARRNKTTKKRNKPAGCYAALNWITSAPTRNLSR